MATRDEHRHSKKSVLLVDDPAATPLLYRPDTPALTTETILERSRQRCPPAKSLLLDNVRRAANAGAGLLSASARAFHDRATNLGLRLRTAARPGSRLPAAYQWLQAVRPRPRTGRLSAGATTLVLLMVLAIAVAMAPGPRRASVETQSDRSAEVPSLPTVAPESRPAHRSIAPTRKPQNAPLPVPTRVGTSGKRSDAAALVRPRSGAVVGPVTATRWKSPSASRSGSSRRAASSGLVGSLLVNSEPSGAEVLINGIPHGRTPLRVSALPAGSRVVRLELPGYERWSWAINIAANKRTPVRVKLQPERRRGIPGS